MGRITPLLLTFCLTFSYLSAEPSGGGASPTPAGKPKILKADDLPRFTYDLKGSSEEILGNPAALTAVADKISADVQNVINSYDIEDKTALKRLKDTLLAIDVMEGKNDESRALISELRQLEDKPALKDMTGLFLLVRLDVIDETKSTDLASPAFQKLYRKILLDRLDALPWDEVQDEVKESKGGMEGVTKNLIMGGLTSELDPVLEKTGGKLTTDMVMALIDTKNELTNSLPLQDALVAVLGDVIALHASHKPEIWSERDVTLDPKTYPSAKPVVVAIWDSGVDDKLFPDQLFTNPNQTLDGKDDDNNGWIDDVHGIAYDVHSNRVTGTLFPMGDDAQQLNELKSYIKGSLDEEMSIDSPEKKMLLDKEKSLSENEVKSFEENIDKFGNYMHGTHVATISSKGNPFIRMLIARITFDYHVQPELPTVEQAKKDAQSYQDTIDYFKAHNVRVANMSWGGDLASVQSALEMNGVTDPAEVKKRAREIFDIDRNGLESALKNAPGILFVVAAGNGNNDVNFDENFPAALKLPNLISVGAVDQAGEPTSFTSFGSNVSLYADGFQVDGMIPGGSHLLLSGTSMASPEVTNLAAKLFALKPELTPEQVIDLIKQGSTATNDKRVNLIDPKKTIELLSAPTTTAKP